MKAGFLVPEKARHPGAFRVSTPSLGDIGRIRRRRRNPPNLRSFRKAGLNNTLSDFSRLPLGIRNMISRGLSRHREG